MRPGGEPIKKGNRKPSARLYTLIRKWSDEEWRGIVAFSEIYGKGSVKMRHLKYLREMHGGYDAESEITEFSQHNLYMLRYEGLRYSYSAARRMDFVPDGELYQQFGNIAIAIGKECWEDASEFLSEAIAMAELRGEYLWLLQLLEQKRIVVLRSAQGNEALSQLNSIHSKVGECLRWIQINSQIALSRAQFLEEAKQKYIQSGTPDPEVQRRYWLSEVGLLPLDGLPAGLQLERLAMDELVHAISENYESCCKVIEHSLALLSGLPFTTRATAARHAMLLRNHAAYLSALGRATAARHVLEAFQKVLDGNPRYSLEYLPSYLFCLLEVAIDTDDMDLMNVATALYEEHISTIEELPASRSKHLAVLQYCAIQIGCGNIARAWPQFVKLLLLKEVFHSTVLFATFAVFHIVLLVEQNDFRGIEAHGRNYLRRLRKESPITIPAIAAIRTIQQAISPITPKTAAKLVALRKELTGFKNNPTFSRSLFYKEIIAWLDLKTSS